MKKVFTVFFFVFISFLVFAGNNPGSGSQTAPGIAESKTRNIAFGNKRPRNIILLIGDGMGLAQSYSAFTANKGHLYMYEFPVTGFSKTYSSDNYITDSAAGGTAIACGVKTYNGAIGVDPEGKPVRSILELAEAKGLSTGLVATYEVTNATPASFIAHQAKRSMEADIAADYLKTDIDVIIGGGRNYFQPHFQTLKERGYQIKSTLDEVKEVTSGKLAAFLAEKHNPSKLNGRGDMLPVSTSAALKILGKNPKGFFIMIEGSMIDGEAHSNKGEGVIAEANDFDKAVKAAVDFAEKDGETLVIVTADHETGGLTLTGGNLGKGEVKTTFSTGGHTAVMVPVFAYGPGAKYFTGVFENTDIFLKMKALLKL